MGLIYATIGEHETAVERFIAATGLDNYLAVALVSQPHPLPPIMSHPKPISVTSNAASRIFCLAVMTSPPKTLRKLYFI